MKFELNQSKQAMRPKGSREAEWFSARCDALAIHVHNHTEGGQWAYKLLLGGVTHERIDFACREEAERAAIRHATHAVRDALAALTALAQPK